MTEDIQQSCLIKEMPFPFVDCMPYLDSNMSSKKIYPSVGSEILRISRTSTDLINVVTHVKLYLTRMKKQ